MLSSDSDKMIICDQIIAFVTKLLLYLITKYKANIYQIYTKYYQMNAKFTGFPSGTVFTDLGL